MSLYVYIPSWFLGIDSFLELFIIFISLILAIYSYKTYKEFDLNKYFYLALSFIFFSLSFIAKIISNLIFIIPIKKQIDFYFVTITYTTFKEITLIDNISFFLHKLFILLSIIIFYLIISKEKKKENIFLIFILTLFLSYYIDNYFIFNLILIIILELLFLISYKKDKYEYIKKENNKNRKLNLIKKVKINILNYYKTSSTFTNFFLILLISYFLNFFAPENNLFYVFSEILLIIGFIYLLLNFIKIFLNKNPKINKEK